MSTTPYGENDPLTHTTPIDPIDAPTPIADGLIGETGLGSPPGGVSTTSGSTETSGSTDSSGGVGGAKEKASDALGSASEHGSQVAGTAKDEALKVASEAKEKATDLLGDLRSQIDEQSKTQLSGLAAKLGELGDELQSLLSGSPQSGTVSDVAQQLADKTHQLSSHLDSRQPMDLLEDFRGFARRRPAAFLAGAAVAGMLAGRLTRGAKAAQDTGSTPPSSQPLSTPTFSDPSTIGTTSTPLVGGYGEADDDPAGQNMGGRQ